MGTTGRSCVIRLAEAEARIPGPAGEHAVSVLQRGTLTAMVSVGRFAPLPRPTTPHAQDEVYVIVRGSGRIRVEDEIVEVGPWDAVRFDKDTMRAVEAGPEGIEYVAFGAGDDPMEVEMSQDFWAG